MLVLFPLLWDACCSVRLWKILHRIQVAFQRNKYPAIGLSGKQSYLWGEGSQFFLQMFCTQNTYAHSIREYCSRFSLFCWAPICSWAQGHSISLSRSRSGSSTLRGDSEGHWALQDLVGRREENLPLWHAAHTELAWLGASDTPVGNGYRWHSRNQVLWTPERRPPFRSLRTKIFSCTMPDSKISIYILVLKANSQIKAKKSRFAISKSDNICSLGRLTCVIMCLRLPGIAPLTAFHVLNVKMLKWIKMVKTRIDACTYGYLRN